MGTAIRDSGPSHFHVFHAGEQLRLTRVLTTHLLIVHLSPDPDRPTKLELDGNALTYDEVEVLGQGTAEIWNRGALVRRWHVRGKRVIRRDDDDNRWRKP